MTPAKNFVDQPVALAFRWKMPLHRQHLHSHGPYPGSHSSTDVAIADDSHCAALNGQYVEGFPDASHLISNHPPKVFCKIQDGSERKLSKRCTEHTGPVGKHCGTFPQLRK